MRLVTWRYHPIGSLLALPLALTTGSLPAAALSGSEAVVCVGSETRTLATNPIRRVYQGRDDNVVRAIGRYLNGREHGTGRNDASENVVGAIRCEHGRRVSGFKDSVPKSSGDPGRVTRNSVNSDRNSDRRCLRELEMYPSSMLLYSSSPHIGRYHTLSLFIRLEEVTTASTRDSFEPFWEN